MSSKFRRAAGAGQLLQLPHSFARCVSSPLEDLYKTIEASPSATQFTCFTGKKVQILTPAKVLEREANARTQNRYTQFTCLLVQKYKY